MAVPLIRHLELKHPVSRRRFRLTLRQFVDDADYAACVALERKTWGEDFAEIVPPSILMISQKVGGISAGAFDERGAMLAMVYGLTGIRDGKPFHWSHMLAVDEAARGLGLGREMKLYQRDSLIAMGVACMEWTYDPLQAVNARLNLGSLGAVPIDYARDVYGSGDTSGLHAGIGTDRFIVRWQFAAPNDARAAAIRFAEGVPVVNTDRAGDPLEDDFALPDHPRLRVEVPADIGLAKQARPGMGRLWRECTRRALQHYMASGWRVTCFLRDEGGRCFYGLERGAVA